MFLYGTPGTNVVKFKIYGLKLQKGQSHGMYFC